MTAMQNLDVVGLFGVLATLNCLVGAWLYRTMKGIERGDDKGRDKLWEKLNNIEYSLNNRAVACAQHLANTATLQRDVERIERRVLDAEKRAGLAHEEVQKIAIQLDAGRERGHGQ